MLAIALAFGTLLVLGAAQRIDRGLRDEIVMHARLVARSLEPRHLEELEGGSDDLGHANYALLKQQLQRARSADPHCRFVYLMFEDETGHVRFHADSEETGSIDESPPGQIYRECSALVRRLLREGGEGTEGPTRDRWGTWVSAYAPLPRAEGRRVLLGLDVDASDWGRIVLARTAPFAVLVLLCLASSLWLWICVVRLHRARASERQLGAVLARLPDPALLLDSGELRVLAANDAAARTWGRGAEALRGERFERLVTRLSCAALRRCLEGQKGDATPFVLDLHLRGNAADANVFELHGRLLADSGGSTLLLVLRDVTACRRREAELRASLARIDELAAHTNTVIWETDAEGRYTYVSAAAAAVYGFAAEELTGKLHYYDLHPAESREEYRANTQGVFRRGEPFVDFENEVERPDGTRIHVSTAGLPILGEDGRLLGYRGWDSDVTRRKLVERELAERAQELARHRSIALGLLEDAEAARRAAEEARNSLARADEKFMAMLRGSAQASLLLDGGSFIACNDVALQLFGAASEEQLLGRPPGEHSPERQPDGTPSSEAATLRIERALAHGSQVFEWLHRRVDGTEVPCEVTLIPVSLFGKQMLYCVLKDISDLIAARTAAEESRTRMESALATTNAILEAVPVGLLVVGRDCRVRRINTAALQLLGLDRAEDIVGSGCHHRVCVDDRGACPVRDQGDEMDKQERLLLREDGTTLPVLKSVQRIQLGDEEVLLEAIVDIADLKRAEERLRASNDELARQTERANELAQHAAQASAAKSEFLANMSHEIRTPMTAILGFAESLQDDRLDDVQRKDAVSTILRNGRHLLQLIGDILDLSKIEAGKLRIEAIDCSPLQIVGEVCSLMAVRASAKGLRFAPHFDGPIPARIRSDPTRLRQILVNLVGNAIKFTERGHVTLHVRHLGERAEPLLEFGVEDSGIGLAPEQLPRLFEAFQQADSSTTRNYGGTGLGLSISQRLAEMLGGEIAVESELGVGSLFTLQIRTGPVGDEELLWNPERALALRRRAPDAEATPPARSLRGRVLLAEDGVDNQRLIRHLLRKAGAECTVVSNGQEAIDAVERAQARGQPFDLVLMDMQMPVLDGYDACRELRRRGATLPIAALTAHAMAADRTKCLSAGCDRYLTKPVDRAQLHAVLAEFLEVIPVSD